jgi:hypothetical protein
MELVCDLTHAGDGEPTGRAAGIFDGDRDELEIFFGSVEPVAGISAIPS